MSRVTQRVTNREINLIKLQKLEQIRRQGLQGQNHKLETNQKIKKLSWSTESGKKDNSKLPNLLQNWKKGGKQKKMAKNPYKTYLKLPRLVQQDTSTN